MTTTPPATLLVDLSNVCRDNDLAPLGVDTAWRRLQALLNAISENEIIEFRGYILVADETLRRRLDRGGRAAFDAERDAGRLEEREFADERLVELALGSDSPVESPVLVTRDFLDDFRRTYPELDSASAIAWTGDTNGAPVPVLRAFGTRTHHRISKKEEEGELYRRQLRRREVQDEAARWYFRCTARSCPIAAFWPDHIEELPRYDSTKKIFVCPGCREELERGSERKQAVQILVYDSDREVARLLVENGVEIGRSDAQGCIGIDRFLANERASTVSRRHLRVSVEADHVFVEDLDSRNGTVMRPRRPGRKAISLRSGSRIAWEVRDALVLPDNIRLERSGRRFHFRGDRVLDGAPDESPSHVTQFSPRR
ncbi:MAG: FHA domain-containing protein [Microthrixaceae bacterium]